MRIVIELRKGELGEVVLNNLYAQTQMQSVFGINIVALVDGEPRLLNLKEVLDSFVRHRREVYLDEQNIYSEKPEKKVTYLKG